MKKSWPITILFCLLIIGGGAAVILWPRTVPFEQCSEIYQKYANMEDVSASFIKDYKVNDTVYVDVTLLEATDSVGWVTLKKDFDIPNPSPNFQQRIDSGKNMIGVKIIPKSIAVDTTSKEYPNNLLAISYLNHTLTIFHIKNDVEKAIGTDILFNKED